jgi:predicted Fe-Mo cluster-binding NifX family protein
MKFAAPFKMNKSESAITKVLGKAKYFGIYDDTTNQLEVIVNENPGGPAIFIELQKQGVEVVLTPHAGPGAIRASLELEIDMYYCGEERKTLLEAVKEFQENKYPKITPENFNQFHGHN